ncbi:MAG: prepilin peptidase [Alphaproteobacteria bacterium]|nr:prepilin peptidase [Alphaproteobacteria bacterium]
MALNLDPGWLWPLVAAPAIGSFLGVLALRLPRGETVALARSACPHCRHALSARDLIPIVSWIAQRGRCRHCAARLGWFYPGIELLAIAVVVWSALVLPGDVIWLACLLGWWLILLGAIDAKEMVLPDILTLPLVIAGLVVGAYLAPDALAHHVVGVIAGFALIAGVGWAYRRLRGRDGIGLGDAKLAAAAGAWVGWAGLPGVVLIAAVSGIATTLILTVAGSDRDLGERIPFGPHLALGLWITWLHGPLVIS